MLGEIRIENILLIESARIRLHSGFNVISGETGVGKSLLLSAVRVLFGARMEKVAGGVTARVEGSFTLRPEDRDLVPDHLLADDEEELVIRVIKKAGGSQRSYVNGSIVSRSELAELAHRLVDVHGQRDMQRLLTEKEQIAVLDAYGSCGELREEYSTVLRDLRAAEADLAGRRELEAEIRDRFDLYRFQASELIDAEIRPGEHAELTARCKLVRRAREVVEALAAACDLLDDDREGAIDRLARSGRELEDLADADPELSDLAERAFALSESTSELVRDLKALGDSRSSLDEDPVEMEERLDLLNALARKYHTDEGGLVERCERVQAELAELESRKSSLESLDADVARLGASVLEIGERLVDRRRKVGRKLEKLLSAELKELRMPHARLSVDPGGAAEGETVTMTPLGLGHPHFAIRTNPGRPYAPLAEAASGGELSRILLALKSILADAHRMPLLVFDEIETGVGPRLGLVLGRRLARLAACRQVLCITHLPQIAAFADCHLKIDKTVRGSKTYAEVEELAGDRRLDELAAMLGGGDEKLARKQARSLLADAGREMAMEGTG